MCFGNFKKIYIICEGKSEYNYLQILMRVLRDCGSCYNLIAKDAGGGQPEKIKRALSKLFEENRQLRGDIWIWIDEDIYKRDEKQHQELRDFAATKRQKITPQFIFNQYNFEDFLSLHFEVEAALDWSRICHERGHFKSSMHGDEYTPLFVAHCKGLGYPEYKKGASDISLALLSDGAHAVAFDNMRRNLSNDQITQRSEMAERLLALLG